MKSQNKYFNDADLYQKACMRTASGVSTATDENLLLQGVMGLCGESGEAIDIVKKTIFQGHPFDEQSKEHLARELGDIAWYLATSAKAIGYPLSAIFAMNIDKLEKRYPDGSFKTVNSVIRKEGDV